MKSKTVLLLITALMVIFSSCRIEKKLYSKGYHITSKKNIAVSLIIEQEENQILEKKSKQTEEVDPQIFLAEKKEEFQTKNHFLNTANEDTLTVVSQSLEASTLFTKSNNHPLQVKTFVFPKFQKSSIPSENTGQNTQVFALISFILGILAIPTFGITGILSLLFGAIAYNRFDNNPKKSQKNRWMAGIGFIFGIISCLLLIAVGIADLAGLLWGNTLILPILGLFALASFIASFIIRS